MRKETIVSRIDVINKHIEMIDNDLENKSFEQFKESDLLVRATCFSLVQIGEHLGKLEELLSPHYPNIPWTEARKMRNLIVHVYDNVKAEIIYETVKNDITGLKNNLCKIQDDIKNHAIEL